MSVQGQLNVTILGVQVITKALGIVTTKYIFAHGLHYPFHLLLIHILAVLLVDTFRWMRDRHGAHVLPIPLQHQFYSTNRGLVQLVLLLSNCLYPLCIVGALLCEYQSILHFNTLPALTMLYTLDWAHACFDTAYSENRLLRKTFLSIVCLGGMTLIYVFDRKLSKSGMVLSILSILLAGIIRYFDNWTTTSSNGPTSLLHPMCQSRFTVLMLSIISTLVLIRRYEYPLYTPVSPISLGGILAVNLFATVASLESNLSLFRHDWPLGDWPGIWQDTRFKCLVVPISLVGLVTIGDVPINAPVLISIWQYTGFLISLLAVYAASHKLGSDLALDWKSSQSSLPSTQDYELLACPSNDSSVGLDRTSTEARDISRRSILILCILLSSLPASMYWTLHSTPRRLATLKTRVDTLSNTTRSMDFVISRFEEPAEQIASQLNPLLELSSIRDRTKRIVVYNTGDSSQEAAFRDQLHGALHPEVDVIVDHRSNVGREGAAFLHHIYSRWNELSDHTLFMQARLHDSWGVKQRLQDFFVAETGFLSLSQLQEYCSSCDKCWDHSTWSEDRAVLEDIYSRANAGAECESFVLTYRGQFVASKRRIHSQGRELFQDLLGDLTDSNSQKHSQEYIGKDWLPHKVDTMNSPVFGYTLERLWGALMQCSNLQLAFTCPSMLSSSIASALRFGSSMLEDCQCLDE